MAFLLAAVGIVLAHAGNNLVNDIFDESLGADIADYPRALYAPHPALSATRRPGCAVTLVHTRRAGAPAGAGATGWGDAGFAPGR